MPTILQIDGFRFFFYSADRNEPPHVHVVRGDGFGKIWLEPGLRVHYLVNFKKQEQLKILEIVEDNKEHLILKWYEFFNE